MTTADTERMLIESAMPAFDVAIAEHVIVAAIRRPPSMPPAPWIC